MTSWINRMVQLTAKTPRWRRGAVMESKLMSNLDIHKNAGGHKKIRAESVLVTPEMARKWRDEWHFERQRNISPVNVRRLSSEMEKGFFIEGTPIFVCELPDFRRFIVNGNHTLEAVHASGKPYPLVVIFRSVETMDQVAATYANFDLQKARTWMDAVRAAGNVETTPLLAKAVPALGVIQSGFTVQSNERTTSRMDRLQLLEEYTPSIEALAEAIANTPRISQSYILRATVLAVVLETVRYQPSTAVEFWRAVASEEAMKPHPAKALWSFLRNVPPSATWSVRMASMKAAALAWNANFKGKDLEYCKPNAWQDFFILGTPWKGNE